MAITLQNVTSFIRSLIGEATARYWTDAEITLYIQMASTKVQAQFFHMLWDRYKLVADLATTAATSLYNYPTDAVQVVSLQVKETGENLRYVYEDEFYRYAAESPGDPRAWTRLGGQIKLFPTPATSDTDYLYCWYWKNLTITATTPAVTDFPDCLKSLIGIEAVILSRAKDHAVTDDLIQLRRLYEQNVLIELSTSFTAANNA